MNSLRVLLRSAAKLPRVPRPVLLGCAALVAATLLSMYVSLLRESVERGVQLRDGQQTSERRGNAKPAISRLSLELVPARKAAAPADLGLR